MSTVAVVDQSTASRVRLWAWRCGIAEVIGMTAAAGAARAVNSFPRDSATAVLAAVGLVLCGGLVEGAAVGVAQAGALRVTLPALRTRLFIALTVVGAGIGWAGGSLPMLRDDAAAADTGVPWGLALGGGLAVGVVLGALLGAVQLLALRGATRHAARWVPASAVAWAPTMALMMLGASVPGADWPTPVVLGWAAVTGAVAGGVLGAVLGWFAGSLNGPSPHNRVVLHLLRRRRSRRLENALVGLRMTGRKTGRPVVLPVMFAEYGDRIVVAVGHTDRKSWWRNVVADADVAVLRSGVSTGARGEVLLPTDAAYAGALDAYQKRWPKARLDADDLLVVLSSDDQGTSAPAASPMSSTAAPVTSPRSRSESA